MENKNNNLDGMEITLGVLSILGFALMCGQEANPSWGLFLVGASVGIFSLILLALHYSSRQ